MKNSFKMAALALVISVSVAACGGPKKDTTGDSTSKDSAKKTVDTLKNDTTIKNDSTKKDTTVKTVVKTTETKKK